MLDESAQRHADADATLYRDAISSMLRLVLGMGLFVVVLTLVAWQFHDQLERFGRWFVDHFGLLGMASGTFLADGVHFPLPPQFYLLTGVTAGGNPWLFVTSVLAGSILGGLVAFAIGRRLSRMPALQNVTRVPSLVVERLIGKHGTWGLVIAGLLPFSYCLVCAATGLMRLPYRAYGVLALMRIPRIVITYALIVAAWGAS